MDAPHLPHPSADDGFALLQFLQQRLQVPCGHWSEWHASSAQDGVAPASQPPATWATFLQHLPEDTTGSLNALLRELQRQVRDDGVHYNVYGTQAIQRPWALDLFPLILGAHEWHGIAQGVLQRMQLLERLMADAYGAQTLQAAGLLPTALVQGHPGYLPALQGLRPRDGHFLSLAAFDLARGPDGYWWLLSQRTQAPSGLGYLLQNRRILARLFPQALQALRVRSLDATYQTWMDGLRARGPDDDGVAPQWALLTPGPYNETYFEQAFLARHLGLMLVQAEDLTVRNAQLHRKTLDGLQRLHGVVKRVDDTWLDPLELRSDSALGVPGLLHTVRRGHVLLANTPGSGFLESGALLGFMPALARRLLGEDLLLPAVPSWWCGEAAALPQALNEIGQGIIKPTYPGATGRTRFEPVLGRNLDASARKRWAERIAAMPDEHTVQRWLPISHLPVWHEGSRGEAALQTRAVVLRVFVLRGADGRCQVLPGGLARLGTRDGLLSMQRGGSSADVWVQSPQDDATQRTTPSVVPPLRSAPAPRGIGSREAENLFWLGRYTERAENMVRLTQLAHGTLLHPAVTAWSPVLDWLLSLCHTHGVLPAQPPVTPTAAGYARTWQDALLRGAWSRDQATGVAFNVCALHAAAQSLRERLTHEHVQLLDDTLAVLSSAPPGSDTAADHPDGHARALRALLHRLVALTGAQTDHMHRDDGWRLLSLGRHLERLDFLAGALHGAIATHALEQVEGFDAVLTLFDASVGFHAQYADQRTLPALMTHLVSHADNPRALAWVARTLRARLLRLEHLAGGATRALAEQVPSPWRDDTPTLWASEPVPPRALLPLLHAYQTAAWRIAEGLGALFFTHSHVQQHSVGG